MELAISFEIRAECACSSNVLPIAFRPLFAVRLLPPDSRFKEMDWSGVDALVDIWLDRFQVSIMLSS